MVSTRGHPSAFPEPTLSPVKSSSPTKSTRSTPALTSTPPPMLLFSSHGASQRSRASSRASGWSHTPSNMTLIWLAISLPLVIWDSAYVFLRPHSMPGGKYQWPLFMPYELYGTIDYVYGWPAYHAHNGFTAAQASLNVVETLGYFAYLAIVYSHGRQENTEGRGAPSQKSVGFLGRSRTVYGRMAGVAALIAWGTALMTLSKTVLYWLVEAFSGFDNIGHNDALTLIIYWIIPNGAWLVFPSYMLYVFGAEILQGLEVAAGGDKKTL